MRIKARRAGAALIAVVASVVGFGLTGSVRAADRPPSRIIYVRQAAIGANDGTSWADAYTDLQDALGAAVAGDEIWVAQGIYRPDRGTGDQQATFRLVDGVGLYGGFAGWETNRDQRDVAAHPTVLSGDFLDDDDPGFVPTSNCCGKHAEEGCDNDACYALICPLQPGCCDGSYGQWAAICAQYAQSLCCELCGPDRCDNSFHVLTAEGASASVLLDGFTVTAGHARVNQPEFSGGGLLNLAGEATIANCLFR